MAEKKATTKVAEALSRLDEKKKEIEARRAQKPQWATSCRLELPGWEALTIQVERNMQLLAHAAGTLARIGEDLDAQDLPSTWESFPVADWIADLSQRITWLRDDETLRKVQAMAAKVKPLQTEDQRRESEMDALTGDLDALLS